MRTISQRWFIAAGIASAVILAAAVGVRADTGAAHFRAFAVNFDAPLGTQASGVIDIVVDRWSTEAERDQLLHALVGGGQSGLLEAIQDAPRVGYVRVPGSLGTRLYHAWREVDTDGNAKIMLVTDRPVGFAEAIDRPRTMDYRFAVVELQVDANGTGRGTFALAAQLVEGTDEGTLSVKSWTAQPVFLHDVRTVDD
jgi:hypothetical protein